MTALGSLVARLPKGIMPLAAVTLVHQSTGSYAAAGVVTAALALGDAAATPFQGRLLDRFGRGRVLVPSAVVYAPPVRDGRPAAAGAGAAGGAGGAGGALRVPAVRALVASTVLQGMVFGALPVIVPALAARAGAASLAGLLLAAWTLGGVAGSLRRTTPRYAVALTGLSVALAVVATTTAVSGGRLVPVAVALATAGLFLTPVAAASYLVVGVKTRAAHRIEAFAWLSTALAVGGSAGSAAAGTAVQHLGPVTAMALPAAVATVATAIAVARRSALDPDPSERQ